MKYSETETDWVKSVIKLCYQVIHLANVKLNKTYYG